MKMMLFGTIKMKDYTNKTLAVMAIGVGMFGLLVVGAFNPKYMAGFIWFLDNLFSWPNFAHVGGGIAFACLILQFVKWPKYLRAALAFTVGTLANAVWELLVDKWHLFSFGAHCPDYWDIVNGGVGALFVVLIYLFRNRK